MKYKKAERPPDTETPRSRQGQGSEKLSKDGQRFLIKLATTKVRHLTRIYEEDGWSSGRGNRTKDELLRWGMIEVIPVSAGGRGRPMHVVWPSEKGWGYLGQDPRPIPGEGEVEHRFFQNMTGESGAQLEYSVELSRQVNGNKIDVLLWEDDRSKGPIGIEIERSAANLAQAERDIEAGCRAVIILTKGKKLETKARKVVEGFSPAIKKKIKVGLLSDAMNPQLLEALIGMATLYEQELE